jgi:hypothetical protein
LKKNIYYKRLFGPVINIENINIYKGEILTSKYIRVPYLLYKSECCQTWNLSYSHFISVKREREGVGGEREREREKEIG